MRRKIIKTCVIIISALLILLLGFYWGYVERIRDNTSYVNSMLYDLSHVMHALEYMNNAEIDDPQLREKLEIIVVAKLVSMSQIDPKLDDLQGTPIETLCRNAFTTRSRLFISN
jgi:hypothetical protein